jgi:transcriptional regulator with XRE-family HTH domain
VSSSQRFGPERATPPPRPFGALLRHHRILAGLTQEALAERAGLSGRAISDLERGVNRTPQPGTLDLLAEALQLSAEERASFEAAARREKLAGWPVETPPDTSAERPLVLPGPAAMPIPVALAPHTSPARRSLPTPPTPLIGREREVQALCGLLQRTAMRLLTLVGTAGVGKTRLALQVATEVAEAFADGSRSSRCLP